MPSLSLLISIFTIWAKALTVVYLLRIRIKDQKQVDKLMFVAADKRCPTIYLVAEIDADFIDDNLIVGLLDKFHSGKYDH